MNQLALPFPRAARFRAADLLPNPGQEEARAWLDATPTWPLGRLVLWGPPGSGKTHLLHAWAETQAADILQNAPPGLWPDRPLAIDGIDAIPDEPALFHLLNAASETRQPVLLTAAVPPARLPIRLPDLASRLRATTAIGIGPAGDAFLDMLLARLLAERQLRVPPPIQAWMLARLVRTPAAIRNAVDTLDRAAMQDRRAITRPMAAAVLGFHDNPGNAGGAASPPPPGLG